MKRLWSIILLTAVLGLHSCFRSENYPTVPVVTYDEFNIMGDSGELIVGFTDGEGDIGLYEWEDDAPYDSGSYYAYNLYVEYFELKGAAGWQPGLDVSGDTVVFKYRLKPLPTVTGEPKGVKGRFRVNMSPYKNPFSSDSDTIMYRITLIDRALNVSEPVDSEMIITQ